MTDPLVVSRSGVLTTQGETDSLLLIKLRKEMIDFLCRHDWAHFATLTIGNYDWEGTEAFARRYFERAWVRTLEKAAQQRVRWFWAQEGGSADKRRHMHALLGGSAGLDPSWMEAKWIPGVAQVTPIPQGPRAAVAYLLKNLDSTWDDYDIYRRSKSSCGGRELRAQELSSGAASE